MKFKNMLILLTTVYFCMMTVAAQQFDCPPNFNSSDWTLKHKYIVLDGRVLVESGLVDYYERQGTDGTEIVIDWSTFENREQGKVTDETMKELLTYRIIKDGTPACPFEGTKKVSIVTQTECKIQFHCYLKLDRDRQVVCQDDGWDGPSPEYYTSNNDYYFRVPFEKSCGFKCCRKVYTIKCVNNEKVISGSYSETYPGSDCSGSSSYTDCKTGETIPCQGNCD